MSRTYGHDNAGQPYVSCDDEGCLVSACPEHGGHDALGDHTFEQHHDPTEHCGRGPCLCPGWGDQPSESPEGRIE